MGTQLRVACCALHAARCVLRAACRLPVYATKEELTVALRKNFGPFGQIESVKAALAHTPSSTPSSTPRVPPGPLESGLIGSVKAAHTLACTVHAR